ncbi:amidohydrolase family protein [Flavitalea flava]
MTYRKFKADYLFNGWSLVAPDMVLVTSEDGTVDALVPFAEAGEGVEHLSGMLSPGFVNCHCHLELSHLKGRLPEKTGLTDFLLAVLKQRHSDPETIQSAIRDAEEAMMGQGIVAVGDICNTTDTLSQKSAGQLYYHNFIETMGFLEKSAPERFDHSRKTFEAYAQAFPLPKMAQGFREGRPIINRLAPIKATSLVPHAPYSVSPRLFDLIANFPGNHLLTIHSQESEAENVFYQSGQGDFLRLYEAMGLDVSFFHGTGKRSLESYLPHFYPNQSLILVHNVATAEEDLLFAHKWQGKGGESNRQEKVEHRLFFCLCPNANLYIGGQLPDVDLLIRHHCAIVVGTDSLASNHQLSILEELITLQHQFPHLQTATLLQWATANGAAALQFENILGDFTPGKQPGVLLLEELDGERLTAASRVRRLV